jgi:hypothetical protein
MNLKIEKGVPLPTVNTGLTATIRILEIGDSFLIPLSATARSNVAVTAKRIGVKVVTRKDGDNIRVWRTA